MRFSLSLCLLPLLLSLCHSVSSSIVRFSLGSSSCICLSFHGHWVVGTCSAKEVVVLAVVGESTSPMAAGSGGNSSGFVLTPHKLAICMLTHAYASPASASPPFRALPADARRRLALFLLDHSKVSSILFFPPLCLRLSFSCPKSSSAN